MTDTGYWLVMVFMAVVVVLATGGVTAYAYFSQDRWGQPRTRATQPDKDDSTADERQPQDIAA